MGAAPEGGVEVGVGDGAGLVQGGDDVSVGVGDEELAAVSQEGDVQPGGLPDVGVDVVMIRQSVVLGDLTETVGH